MAIGTLIALIAGVILTPGFAHGQAIPMIAMSRSGDTLVSASIWTFEPVSGDLIQITDDLGLDVEPVWSPDGEKIAFVSVGREGAPLISIFMVDVGTGALTQLTDGLAEDRYPTWSPDGAKLAFSRRVEGGSYPKSLWTVDVNTLQMDRLTEDTENEIEPAWSSGNVIAYVAGSPYSVWTLDMETDVHMDREYDGTHPAWSPDGEKVAWQQQEGGNGAIFIVDPSTGLHTNLTGNQRHDATPSWSPDGTDILFSSLDQDAELPWNLWSVNIDTGTSHRSRTSLPVNRTLTGAYPP